MGALVRIKLEETWMRILFEVEYWTNEDPQLRCFLHRGSFLSEHWILVERIPCLSLYLENFSLLK